MTNLGRQSIYSQGKDSKPKKKKKVRGPRTDHSMWYLKLLSASNAYQNKFCRPANATFSLVERSDYSVAKTAMIIAKIRTKQQAVNEVLCRAMSCPIGTVNIVRCGED